MIGSSTPSVVAFLDAAIVDVAINSCGFKASSLLHAELISLCSDRDGIEQITEILHDRSPIEQLHIVSNCCDNSIHLGKTQLNLFNLDRYGWQLQQWGNVFASNAQILLGCCGSEAAALPHLLIDRLALLTGAKVAYSNIWLEPPQPQLLDCSSESSGRLLSSSKASIVESR